ncbi:lipopolysaccharide biosynthesis protein [Microbacterium sp. KSW2-29]|uniref:Lipopolysaccharide biosynthesis protein n=1 Tax=Microbacterium phycohabitans TaxID=3075993 RepID=A0ABU3SLX8_9MICO|nr:lipopolysaccharide biosynthesis protein [Microbacterium sp. KSW2-29]MDU0345739.1 lipopolysaccharide biosynthesis protein [Microbacterium sp. KSW2-29]
MTPEASAGARARGATLLLSTQWVRYLLQIVNLVVLARLIGPGDFGVVSLGLALVGIASVLGDFGLSLAALRESSLSQQQKSNLLWINSGIGAVSALVVGLCAAPIAAAFDDDRLVVVVLLAAPAYLLRAGAVQFLVELNRRERFSRLAAAEVGGDAIGVGTAVVLALAGSGYVALAVQGTVAAAVTLLWASVAAQWRPSLPRRAEMRSLLTFGLSTLGAHAAQYVTTNVDTIMLGAWYPASVVGFYSRAYQLVMLPLQQVAAPLTRVVLPRLARVADDLSTLNDELLRAQRLVSHVLLGVTGLLVVGGAPLIEVVLGAEWLPAMQFLPVLAVGTVFQTIAYAYYWGFAALGRSGALFFSELIGRVPMVLLIVLLAPLAPTGVAWGVVAGQVLIWASGTFVFAPRAGLRRGALLRSAVVPLLVSGGATLGSWGMDAAFFADLPAIFRLASVTATWAVAAGLLMFLCGRSDARLMRETLRTMRPQRSS